MYDIETVRVMSQEEGLNDRQIADKLGCSRVTITRIRTRNNIPRCEIYNRKDKHFVCLGCGDKVYIKRKDRRQAFCEKCLGEDCNISTI